MAEYRKAPEPPLPGRIRRWVHSNLGATIVGGIVAGVVLLTIGHLVFGQGDSGHSTTIVQSPSGAGLSSNPRARIVELTGSWSEENFIEAIFERNTSTVTLYLNSGMSATTLHKGASAILWGFQGPQNGDPIALIKTFQAAGFKVDEELQDSYLMPRLTEESFPLHFETNLAPEGYSPRYWRGEFIGSLLFWIVERASWAGPSAEDIEVMDYLISQGANCSVPLSFLEFNRDALGGTRPYRELLSMMQSCA